jgi:hypothetical protein
VIAKATGIIVILFFLFCLTLSCNEAQHISLWERHCEACHDGKTILNGKVVIDKQQMKAKYKTLDEFANACAGGPTCMNIVKHEEKLLREVGTEIGITNNAKQ